jgi:hypothetical protein
MDTGLGATNAYTVMGHGNEDPRQIYKVPKGCTLIVAGHSSEPTFLHDILARNIQLLYPENHPIILDPLKFKKDIFELLGSVAIYTEGEEYPNYIYSLLSYFPAVEGDTRHILLPSGLINVTQADKKLIYDIDGALRDFSPDVPVTDNSQYKINGINTPLFVKGAFNPAAEQVIRNLKIPQLFNNSIVIRPNEVDKILKKLIQYIKPKKIKYKYYNIVNFIGMLSDKIKISQKQIFDMVERGKVKPGVFYNFVCRVTGKKLEDSNLLQPVSKLAPEVKGRISEAAIQRRRLLTDVFTESKNPFKTLRNRRTAFNTSMTKKVLLRKRIHTFFL